MNYPLFKKLTVFAYILLICAILNVSHAQTVAGTCGSIDIDNPSPLAIICPFVKVFNVAVLGAGGLLVIIIIYGAIKLAMSLGDPKGYQAAQQTWFWGVIGFAVIVGAYSLIYILDKILGLGIVGAGPNSIFDNFLNAFTGLLTEVGISGF